MSNINLSTSPKLIQQQRLVLTQELQLFLKLIQMNTLEMKEYIEDQLIENPTLEEIPQEGSSDEKTDNEEKEEYDLSELVSPSMTAPGNDDNPHLPSYGSDAEDENPWENRVSLPESLLDHLRWQLEMLDASEYRKELASDIIGNINEDGYLETDIEDIAVDFLDKYRKNGMEQGGSEQLTYELVLKDARDVLCMVQTTFDPVGVASRDLRECLKLQLLDLGYNEDSNIVKIIENHLEDIGKKDYNAILASIDEEEEQIDKYSEIISRLEPRPGRPFYSRDTEKYVVADFFLYKVGNDYQLQLNREFPRIRISRYYRNLINRQKELPRETRKYLKEKIESAQRILKCIEEREEAVRKIVTNVVEVQRDFFEHGEKYLKPLRLKDIAGKVGVHESTVSRITSNRYIQTPSGVIELKSLFTRGLDTTGGDKQVSYERVISMIKDIIDNESAENPFSDEDIAKILKRKNVSIARRTVAKYRKVLKIPSSSKRAKKGGK